MATDALTHRGGHGRPIVLVHGLMGRGTTWLRQLPWLGRYGAVYTYDAPWHRGRDVADDGPVSTERLVAALATAVSAVAATSGPVTLVGHSMGGLHSWCLAAARPDLVSALIVEDMAPDFRGQTTDPWEPWLRAMPVEFASEAEIVAAFGEVAGRYFAEAFDRTTDGWRVHGRMERWIEIAAEWGTREYWGQWRAVAAPALLIEAGASITPAGQMAQMHSVGPPSTYLRVPGAGHLVHDDAPQEYRAVVEAFLATFAARS